jgi:hypothetical protein
MCNYVHAPDKQIVHVLYNIPVKNVSIISRTNHNTKGRNCEENVLTCLLSIASFLLDCTETH